MLFFSGSTHLIQCTVVVAAAHCVEARCIEKNKLQPEPDNALNLGQSSNRRSLKVAFFLLSPGGLLLTYSHISFSSVQAGTGGPIFFAGLMIIITVAWVIPESEAELGAFFVGRSSGD